ncbi:hypothetical protein G6F63_014246 [Rhizopus arrhizus]|nr:hypothetical protein G6F63_014246 [Rhizopus arrhizus]
MVGIRADHQAINGGGGRSNVVQEFKPPPHVEARPIPAGRFRPEFPRYPDRPARGQRGRRPGGHPRQHCRRTPAGQAAVLPAGPAVHRLPAADPAAGTDAGPAAGHRPPVPRLGNGGDHRHRRRPQAPAAAAADAGGAGGAGGRCLLAVAGPVGRPGGRADDH